MNIIPTEHIVVPEIVRALQVGETVVYPTETSYGLGADATNADAVAKLFAIKKRQAEKSMLVLMSDVIMAKQYVAWSEALDELARKYWPGALTVVAPLRVGAAIAPGVIGEGNTLAFRVTSHPLAAALVQQLGRPLVSTSANISAQGSPYDCATVVRMFEHEVNQPDWILDAGNLPVRSPSTIVQVVPGEPLRVLRQGEVVVE